MTHASDMHEQHRPVMPNPVSPHVSQAPPSAKLLGAKALEAEATTVDFVVKLGQLAEFCVVADMFASELQQQIDAVGLSRKDKLDEPRMK